MSLYDAVQTVVNAKGLAKQCILSKVAQNPVGNEKLYV